MNCKFTLALLLAFSSLDAQQTIATDRPDQTETASITPTGFLQIETGLQYEKAGPRTENFSHPGILLKYGVNENFEVRMETEFKSENALEEYQAGFSPLIFGFKARLAEEKKVLPKISFIGALQAGKFASRNFRAPYAAPSFRFLFEHTLTQKLSLGYNLGAEWDGWDPAATGIYTVSAAYSFTDRLGSFIELYGLLNKSAHADHRFDAGINYLMTDNLMIDASSGFGLSTISPEYFVSGGISCRFPLK